MNDLSKIIIDRIIDYPIDKDIVFGDYISPILFPAKKFALYFENDNDTSCALYFTPKGNKGKEGFLSLLEIVSVMSKLEEENLIFATPSHTKLSRLFYNGKNEYKTIDHDFKQINLDGTTMHNCSRYSKTIEKDGTVILTSNVVPKQCVEQLQKFFTSVVLPTSALKEFKERGFITVEEYNTKEALRKSKIGNWVAIIAACSSIAFGINNCSRNNTSKSGSNSSQESSITISQFSKQKTISILDSETSVLVLNTSSIKESNTKDYITQI